MSPCPIGTDAPGAISGNVTSRHRARETMKTPDFIPPMLWPQNSPDLNRLQSEIGNAEEDL